MPLTALADHVAVAVPSIETAAQRWRDELGGGWVSPRFAAEPAGLRFTGTDAHPGDPAVGAATLVPTDRVGRR